MNDKNRDIRRGDIYYADLSPVIGSEQGGVRPVLILQNNTGNKHSPTIIVAAVTGNPLKPSLPTHVPVGRLAGLRKKSIVLLEQIRTIDCQRLLGYIGALEPDEMKSIDYALAVSFGLAPGYQ